MAIWSVMSDTVAVWESNSSWRSSKRRVWGSIRSKIMWIASPIGDVVGDVVPVFILLVVLNGREGRSAISSPEEVSCVHSHYINVFDCLSHSFVMTL